MKKLILPLLFCIFFLTACAKPVKSNTLSICVEADQHASSEKWLAEFKRIHPEIQLEIIEIPATYQRNGATPDPSERRKREREEYLQSLYTKIISGDGPDVFFFPSIHTWDEYEYINVFQDIYKAAKGGIFADCTEFYNSLNKNSQFNSVVMEAGNIYGKQYILPLSYDLFGTQLPQEFMQISGIDPNELEDFNSYIEAFEHGMATLHYSMLNKCIPIAVDIENKKINLDGEYFDALFKLWEKYKTAKLGEEYFEPLFNSSLRVPLTNLKNVRVTNMASFLHTAAGRAAAGEQHEILLPLTKNNEITAYITGYVAVSQNCKNKDLAFTFAEFVLSEQAQTGNIEFEKGESVSSTAEHFPVRKNIFKEYFKGFIHNNQYNKYIRYEMPTQATIDSYINLENRITEAHLYIPVFYYNVFNEEFGKYLDGRVDLETAKQNVIKKWQYYLEE